MAPFQCFFVYGVLFPVNSFLGISFRGIIRIASEIIPAGYGICGKRLQFGQNFYEKKKYFFCAVKKFPQQIENTREIIENMSEII